MGYSYADGQYWDDTEYVMPSTVRSVEATLYYQTTSKEYIEFLQSENVTDTLGNWVYNLWNSHGKGAPELMISDTASVEVPPLTEVDDLTLTFEYRIGGDLHFLLEWTDVGADQYRIYTAEDAEHGPWTELGTTDISYFEFTVTAPVEEDRIGFYYVVAENLP